MLQVNGQMKQLALHFWLQATNLRSFQLLQEYLTAAKEGGNTQRFVYHFEFYIRRNETETDALEKVEVSLPPPQSKYHPQRGLELLPATRSAIGRLFVACGLSPDFSGGVLAGSDEELSLSDFFQQASELQRQNEASILNAEMQVRVVKNAIRMRSGITVALKSPYAGSAALEMKALEKLAQAVDRCASVSLAGFALFVGDSYGVDALGNIWLNGDDDVEAWTKFLHKADLQTATAHKVAARERHSKELEVAGLMKVAMVFAHTTLAVTPAYALFLTRIAEGAKQHGAVGAGKFIELPVQVTGATHHDLGKKGGRGYSSSGCHVDEAAGTVVVSVSEEFRNVYDFIDLQGEEALRHRRKQKGEEKKLEELKVQVRKKLRLRHLTVDPSLSSEQQMSGCIRLLRSGPDLLRYTEGLSLCISDDFRLPEGTKRQACLKWNFSISDL
jgi:hypothetical protein